MKASRAAIACAVAIALVAGFVAVADNYDAKDGNGIHQTFAAKLVAGILHPLHVMEGMFGSTPTAVTMTNTGALDVTCTAGCAASGNNTLGTQGTITAADSATTPTAGQGGVNAITGSPTAGSFVTYAIAGAASGGTLTISGTFVATSQIEVSFDSAAHYTASSALLRGTNLRTSGITGPGAFSLDLNGVTNVRVRSTAYTSGTETVNFTYSAAPGMTKVLNGVSIVDSAGANVDLTPAGSGIGTIGSAVPANGVFMGGVSSGNLTGIIQADTSAKVSISTITTTQVVALSGGKKIYVTNFNLHAGGTTTTKFVYGTGSNCGTGTTDLTDLYDLTASDGVISGGGLGPVLVVPAGNALCIFNSAAIHVGGSLAFTQF